MVVFRSAVGFEVKPKSANTSEALNLATRRRCVTVGCILAQQALCFGEYCVKASKYAVAPICCIVWGWDETYQWVLESDTCSKNLRAFIEACNEKYGRTDHQAKTMKLLRRKSSETNNSANC